MAGLFLILALAAFLYGIWLDREVYNALIDTFPPELKDDMTAKLALHGMALRRSAPLRVQRQYIGSLAAGILFWPLLITDSFFRRRIGRRLGFPRHLFPWRRLSDQIMVDLQEKLRLASQP